MMKKTTNVILLLIVTLLLCSCTVDPLSDQFDEAKLKRHAEEIIAIVNTKDYEAVLNCFRTDLRSNVTVQQLKDGLGSFLTDAGNYVKLTSFTAAGKIDASTKEDYAATVNICEYENSSLIYTISFDENYELIGLYVK